MKKQDADLSQERRKSAIKNLIFTDIGQIASAGFFLGLLFFSGAARTDAKAPSEGEKGVELPDGSGWLIVNLEALSKAFGISLSQSENFWRAFKDLIISSGVLHVQGALQLWRIGHTMEALVYPSSLYLLSEKFFENRNSFLKVRSTEKSRLLAALSQFPNFIRLLKDADLIRRLFKKRGRVADFGAGIGCWSFCLMKLLKMKGEKWLFDYEPVLTAYEKSPYRKKILSASDGIEERLVKGDVVDSLQRVKPGFFDVSICANMLHNNDDKKVIQILKLVRERTKKDGPILIVDSVYSPENYPTVVFEMMNAIIDPKNFKMRRAKDYVSLAEQAGLNSVGVIEFPEVFYGVFLSQV